LPLTTAPTPAREGGEKTGREIKNEKRERNELKRGKQTKKGNKNQESHKQERDYEGSGKGKRTERKEKQTKRDNER
jgi:hypothetical protein